MGYHHHSIIQNFALFGSPDINYNGKIAAAAACPTNRHLCSHHSNCIGKMVNYGKIGSALLALCFIGRSCAFAERGAQAVSYTPIVDQWAEGSNLTVTFDLIHADYASLHNGTRALTERTAISVNSWASLVTAAGTTVLAADSAINIYESIADAIKSKSNSNSCSMIIGTDTDGIHIEGFAYEATTSGSNCRTTAEKKTILAAVKKCANHLHSNGAVRGCCKFSHGGTWTGHLRLTGDPRIFPIHSVNC